MTKVSEADQNRAQVLVTRELYAYFGPDRRAQNALRLLSPPDRKLAILPKLYCSASKPRNHAPSVICI